jgi:hypothetical protein
VSHTPAPWAILPAEPDKPYIRIRGTRLGGRYKIANVVDEKFNCGSTIIEDQEQAESMANAQLIAAAPETAAERDRLKTSNSELLEALKGLLDAHAIPSSVCKERPAYDAAKLAISKALGEQA